MRDFLITIYLAPLEFKVKAKNIKEAKKKARELYKNKKHKISRSLDFNTRKYTEDFHINEL